MAGVIGGMLEIYADVCNLTDLNCAYVSLCRSKSNSSSFLLHMRSCKVSVKCKDPFEMAEEGNLCLWHFACPFRWMWLSQHFDSFDVYLNIMS